MRAQLSVCTFIKSDSLAKSLTHFLESDRYTLTHFSAVEPFCEFVEQHKQQLDCLIFENTVALPSLIQRFHEQFILLPAVILHPEPDDISLSQFSSVEFPPADRAAATLNSAKDTSEEKTLLYHSAEVHVAVTQLNEILDSIDHAIAEFVHLPATESLTSQTAAGETLPQLASLHFILQQQQQRLAEKLRERLGYLGVYYKRNPQRYLRNLPPSERQQLLDQLKEDYREIILTYFSKDNAINQLIDEFVNLAFFSDISVIQIVEIHMELMDDFSNQLKLEGRSEEILLDYRLTLIDVIAHLCEMYRRSIPRDS